MITDFNIFESNSSGRFLTGSAAEEWCKKMRIENFTVNGDGTVDVKNRVYLAYMKMTSIPVQFGSVIGGYFNCADNKLKDLVGAPKLVSYSFICDNNKLVTLDGCPETIQDGIFKCSNNELSSLEGLSKFDRCREIAIHNNKLRSLEGMPKHVDGDVFVSNNRLLDLSGMTEVVEGTAEFDWNPLRSLIGIPKYAEYYSYDGTGKLKELITLCAETLIHLPDDLQRSLPRDLVYAMVVAKEPSTEPLLFPGGMPEHLSGDNINNINSLSNFL